MMAKSHHIRFNIASLLFYVQFGVSFVLEGRSATIKSTATLTCPEGLKLQCSSNIYCYGQLLDTVQMAGIYEDSKTFVDMKMKYKPDEILKNFTDLMNKTNNQPGHDSLVKFLKDNFLEPGQEFEVWTPPDWKKNPRFLDLIRNDVLRKWGSDLNAIWKDLGRKIVGDVAKNPDQYSMIYVENPFIIPGSRFREYYYWDSYWIIRGLLYSEMYTTARGMISNFLSLIERLGHIPNGGRVYYTQRSQPPLLAGMIKSYVDFTGNDKFAIDSVKTLEAEFQYWMDNHLVQVKNVKLATYGDKSCGPRPESYREDVTISLDFTTDEARENFFSEIKAAAETGMDFSSRWFISANGTNQGTLNDTKTRAIIPVELNAILFWNARIIAEIYLKANNLAKSAEYEKKSQMIYEAIQTVLWREDLGSWFDYDLLNNKHREYFTPTNLSPLWMKCYNISDSENISKLVLKYLHSTGVDKYPGGVPNSLSSSGQQWDYPNVWPPMQYILIKGLDNLGTIDAKKLAQKWATRWIQSNYKAFNDTKNMYEKYNAEKFGIGGGGGEYEIQTGFGWSNGVVMELLWIYGDELQPAKEA